jgi:cytochrome c-type biogenesis protein CcmH/NrfF
MQGFNWFAWITPFAALFVAGTILVVVVRGRLRAAPAVAAAGVPPLADDSVARARIAHELSELDRDV